MDYLNDRTNRRGAIRAATATAWRFLLTLEPGTPDHAGLAAVLSGATEGTPTAREVTAEGFRLHTSRVLHSLRFYPVRKNGATPTPTPDATPWKGKPEPRIPTRLYTTAAGRLVGRKLDPLTTADTWTGQGFAPNGTDHAADAAASRAMDYATPPLFCRRRNPNTWTAAATAATAALDRAERNGPRRAAITPPPEESEEGSPAWRVRRPATTRPNAAALQRLAELDRAAAAWRVSIHDPNAEEAAFARRRVAELTAAAESVLEPWRTALGYNAEESLKDFKKYDRRAAQ